MNTKTVKQHAADIAHAVASDDSKRPVDAIRREYSRIVCEADLTLGAAAALRNEINSAMAELLVKQRRTLDAIRDVARRGAPGTIGYGEQSVIAFRHGWDVALRAVYDALCGIEQANEGEMT